MAGFLLWHPYQDERQGSLRDGPEPSARAVIVSYPEVLKRYMETEGARKIPNTSGTETEAGLAAAPPATFASAEPARATTASSAPPPRAVAPAVAAVPPGPPRTAEQLAEEQKKQQQALAQAQCTREMRQWAVSHLK